VLFSRRLKTNYSEQVLRGEYDAGSKVLIDFDGEKLTIRKMEKAMAAGAESKLLPGEHNHLLSDSKS